MNNFVANRVRSSATNELRGRRKVETDDAILGARPEYIVWGGEVIASAITRAYCGGLGAAASSGVQRQSPW